MLALHVSHRQRLMQVDGGGFLMASEHLLRLCQF